MPGESYQDRFARVASAYADDTAHAQRIYDYISNLWFMPATSPVLSNGGNPARPADLVLPERGQRLARRHPWLVERECLAGGAGRRHRFLLGQPALDRREGRHERQDLRRRALHSRHGFAHPGDLPGLAAARPSAAVYLPVSHPESRSSSRFAVRPAAIPTARRSISITGFSFPTPSCARVENDEEWGPDLAKDGAVLRKISARALWIRILTARVETGEPYLIFVDHVNRRGPSSRSSRASRSRPRTSAPRSRCRPASTITAGSAPRCAACRRSISRAISSGTSIRPSSRT